MYPLNRRLGRSVQFPTGRAAAAVLCLTVCGSLSVVPAEAKRKQTPVVPPDLNILSVAVSPESLIPGEGAVSFVVEVELPKDLADSSLLEVSSLISSPSKSSLRFLISRQPVGMGSAQGGGPVERVPGGTVAERGPVAAPDREPVAGLDATGAGDEPVSRPGPAVPGPSPTQTDAGSAPPAPPVAQAPAGTRADAEPKAPPSQEPVAGSDPAGAEVGVGGVAAGPPPTQNESVGRSEQGSPESRDMRMTVTLTWDGNDQTGQRVQQGRFNYEIRAKLLVVGENGPRTQMVSWPRRGTIEVK